MRSPVRLLLLMLPFLVAPAAAAPGERSQTLLVTDGVSAAYRLDDGLLVAGTESVYVDGALAVAGGDYALDYARGLLVLLRPVPAWTPIRVTCRRFPLSTPGAPYRLHVAGRRGRVADSLPPDTVPGTPAASDDRLAVSGSKSVGFSVGGLEGTGINQATRLAATGVLGGVSVEAELSDQSSPIPAEGTTRDIEELDRIAIELTARRWRGSFGDVDLSLPVPGFANIGRRALGAVVGLDVGPVRVDGGYARPRGQFASVQLDGEEGIQGPYVLAPDGRSARLVAGSEEVFLDGRRMTRGWDADYTIDYSTGELLFTNRHAIAGRSRIEASFQYVTEEYERDDVLAGGEFAAGPWRAGLGIFREGDDRDRRIAGDLTEEQLQQLAAIGGDTSLAWFDGGQQVGDGEGDYVVEGDHYRYAGRDSGDYDVVFTLVGAGLGDYVYDDTLMAHRHVGPAAGDYVAREYIVLPERRELATVDGGFVAGDVKLEASGAFSRVSHNLFATDGAAVQDGAASFDAGWRTGVGRVACRGRLRGAEFGLPAADSSVDFRHRWGGTGPDEYRQVGELVFDGRPADWLGLAVGAGLLRREDGTVVERYGGDLDLAWVGVRAHRAADDHRLQLTARPTFGPLAPEVSAGDATEDGLNTRSAAVGLGFEPSGEIECATGYGHEWVRSADSTTAATEQGGRLWLTAAWKQDERWSLEGRGARQHRRDPGDGEQDWTHYTGSVSASLRPVAGLSFRGDLNQSYRLVQLRDELFHYVGPDNGDYSLDSISGDYYYDPGGEYERLVVAKGTFAPARERSVTASGEYTAFRPLMLSGSVSFFGTANDTGGLQEMLQYDSRATVNALEPLVTFQAGLSGARSMDRSLHATGGMSASSRAVLELLTSRLPQLDLRASVERTEQSRQRGGGQVEYDENGWAVRLEPVVRAGLNVELAGGLAVGRITAPASYPELGTFELVEWQASAGRRFVFGRHLRLLLEADIVRRSATVGYLPFEVSLSRPLGSTPGLSSDLTYSLTSAVTASVRYRFSDRPDRAADHQLTGEVRAYF